MAEIQSIKSNVKHKLDIDVSEALKGLKALRREAKLTVSALKEVEGLSALGVLSPAERYVLELFKLCAGETRRLEFSLRDINREMFDAVANPLAPKVSVVYKDRGAGATTSAIALARTFDDVVIISKFDLRYGVKTQRCLERGRKSKILIIDSGSGYEHLNPDYILANYRFDKAIVIRDRS